MKKFLISLLILFFAVSGFLFGDTIKLATLNWEPFLGENLESKGFVSEIVREAFAAIGDEVEIEFYPWSRCMALGEAGQVHGVIGAWYNEERAEKFFYSEALLTNKKLFFTLNSSSVPAEYTTLEDLENYTIGIISGFTYSDNFDSADYLTKDKSPDLKTAFEKLFRGRIDIVVSTYYTSINTLENEFASQKDKISELSPALKEDPLYVIFSKNAANGENIRNRFNEGLSKIKEDGTFDSIMSRY